jgi:hypothetical protein
MQQISFDSAGEKAFGASVGYDFTSAFGSIGLAGLSVGVWYSRGWDAINPVTMAGIPKRDEFDLWAQYRPADGPLKGVRLKLQYAAARQQGQLRERQQEFRFIVDYTVLFRNP